MSTPKEATPAAVTEGSKQAGDTLRQRWRWVEPWVWTERMLETLERGVKGGKWFALIDKVYDPRNLRRGFEAVWGNDGAAGSDGQSVRQFAARLGAELGELGAELQESRYQPHPVRRVYIEKPGSPEKRPLGIPAVRDRVVQTALRHVIEPIFEREFAPQSYGFRPGRGCKDALRRVDQLLHPLDLLMQESGREMVRYADDFVILGRSREEAEMALRTIEQWMKAAGLILHPEKTRLVDLNQDGVGFEFLGDHFRRGGKRWPRKKSVHKLKETLRAKTRRTHGQSLRRLIIEEVNPTLRGWYGYFCHSIVTGFNELDGWLRGRLRAILRKRCGGRGPSRGRDHQRWTNNYFARHGLFSLHAARMAAIQPQC